MKIQPEFDPIVHTIQAEGPEEISRRIDQPPPSIPFDRIKSPPLLQSRSGGPAAKAVDTGNLRIQGKICGLLPTSQQKFTLIVQLSRPFPVTILTKPVDAGIEFLCRGNRLKTIPFFKTADKLEISYFKAFHARAAIGVKTDLREFSIRQRTFMLCTVKRPLQAERRVWIAVYENRVRKYHTSTLSRSKHDRISNLMGEQCGLMRHKFALKLCRAIRKIAHGETECFILGDIRRSRQCNSLPVRRSVRTCRQYQRIGLQSNFPFPNRSSRTKRHGKFSSGKHPGTQR